MNRKLAIALIASVLTFAPARAQNGLPGGPGAQIPNNGGASSISPGATPIIGGTNTRVLFNDSGVIGESAGLTFVKGNGSTTGILAIGGQLQTARDIAILSDTSLFTFGVSQDVRLQRGAANTLSLVNNANPQTFRVYGTTDGTNGDWLSISKAAGGNVTIDTVKAGTGTIGGIQSAQTTKWFFGAVDLGATYNFFGNVDTLFAVQSQTTTNGSVLLALTGGGAVTGNQYGVKVSASATGELTQAVQQNGTGAAVFDMLLVGATGVNKGAYSRYGVNAGAAWINGIHPNDASAFKVVNGTDFAGTSYFRISTVGHVAYGGSAPVVSACGGGSPAIASGATDQNGRVTVGTATATCTVTFASAFITSNRCRVTPQSTTAAFGYTYTLSAIVVTATALGGVVFDYSCSGN